MVEERGQRTRVLRLSKNEPWPRLEHRPGRVIRDARQSGPVRMRTSGATSRACARERLRLVRRRISYVL